ANALSNDVSVLLANLDGTFRPQIRFAVGTTPLSIGAGDFDGDGVLDIAVANSGSDDISILIGQGSGTFAPEHRFAGPPHPTLLVVGDLNSDGKLDLAVGNLLGEIGIQLGH